jgi:hypothetical protein
MTFEIRRFLPASVRIRVLGSTLVAGLAVHGALCACSAISGSSDPSSATPASAGPLDAGSSGSDGGSANASCCGGGQTIELNAVDTVTTHSSPTKAPSVTVSLKGRAGLPANASAVYLEVGGESMTTSGGSGCNATWLATSSGAKTVRHFGHSASILDMQVWLPLDADQNVSIDTQAACTPQLRIAVLGWVAPAS